MEHSQVVIKVNQTSKVLLLNRTASSLREAYHNLALTAH